MGPEHYLCHSLSGTGSHSVAPADEGLLREGGTDAGVRARWGTVLEALWQ